MERESLIVLQAKRNPFPEMATALFLGTNKPFYNLNSVKRQGIRRKQFREISKSDNCCVISLW